MGLNRITQEEIEIIEAEVYASLIANTYIETFEKINSIGKHVYGWPKLPEEFQENAGSCECAYSS